MSVLKVWQLVRRKIWAVIFLILLYLVLNFSWSHAALVYMVTDVTCPQKAIGKARRDVARLFGRALSKPLWLCLKIPKLGLDVSHGSTRFAPFLPSVIIVGKKGARRDVMAHEYAHAELAERTSSLLRTYLIPTWFDEGLAMQLDHRRPYTKKALNRYLRRKDLKKPRLDALTWTRQFFKRGRQGRFHYAFARCVVKKWLRSSGPLQPLQLISHIGWQKLFPIEEFRRYEKLCLQI